MGPFEAAWGRDENPRIEDYLEAFAGGEQRALLAALLAAEIEHRGGDGEQPGPLDYLDRFEEDSHSSNPPSRRIWRGLQMRQERS